MRVNGRRRGRKWNATRAILKSGLAALAFRHAFADLSKFCFVSGVCSQTSNRIRICKTPEPGRICSGRAGRTSGAPVCNASAAAVFRHFLLRLRPISIHSNANNHYHTGKTAVPSATRKQMRSTAVCAAKREYNDRGTQKILYVCVCLFVCPCKRRRPI